jgi:hypothetical protein
MTSHRKYFFAAFAQFCTIDLSLYLKVLLLEGLHCFFSSFDGACSVSFMGFSFLQIGIL